MKKPLLALAALAFVGAASAQSSSSVTLWGLMDAGVSHYSQGGLDKTMLDTSGNAGSQLGFRGTEDLGGGLSANFWLEAGLVNSTGAIFSSAFFSRRSTVSLAGNFGEIRLGRDYTPSWSNHNAFDAFNTSGPGADSNITAIGINPLTGVRASNSIAYLWGFAPNGSTNTGRGVYGTLMYAFAGNVSGAPALGEYAGGRLGYASGPVNTAISYAQSKGTPYAADTAAGYSTYKEFNLGGAYDFGVAKLLAHVGTNNSDAAGTKYTQWGIGAKIIAGPGYIPVSYNSVKQNNATSAGASQLAVGYVYNLSKRTALYATVSRINDNNNGAYTFTNSNGSGPGFVAVHGFAYGNGTGYGIGLRTRF